MAETGDEVVDIKLLLELEVEGVRLTEHHHIDVYFLLFDLGQHLVHLMEIMRVDSLLKFTFILVNNGRTSVTTANKPFLSLAGISLEDPVPLRALLAVEALTRLTEVPDVFEIEY